MEQNSEEVIKDYKYVKYFLILSIAVLTIIFFNLNFSLLRKNFLTLLNYYEFEIDVLGTGSMHPTFPKGADQTHYHDSKQIVAKPLMRNFPSGIEIWGRKFLNYDIQRGDIVSFTNSYTDKDNSISEPNGYIKRAIAIDGDEIEIKDGLVYLNEQPLIEPYIAKPRSTFGGEFLAECTKLKIPRNKLFVMGDNRKGSLDSRFELGLIDIDDIDAVIPWAEQKGKYDLNFRETQDDLKEDSKIQFDKQKYLELLNNFRDILRIPKFAYNTKLENSAKLQAPYEFFESKKNAEVPIRELMSQSGYKNTAVAMYSVQGFFEAEELFENQFIFKNEDIEIFKDPKLQEIGIAVVENKEKGCTKQSIILHFGGYIPPNYSSEFISSYKKALKDLEETRPGWRKLKTYENFYKENKKEVDEINSIIDTRIANLRVIINRIDKNEYFTPEEEELIKNDDELYKIQERIAKKLNDK